MSRRLEIGPFLSCLHEQALVLLDTRSPQEFSHASLPGAHSLPLLTDEQRAQVGTTYKREGKQAAIILGFKLAGPFFAERIEQAVKLAPERRVALFCWRGGLRSHIMAWVLGLAGFEVTLLQGGYKAFRHWVLSTLQQPWPPVRVLGGKTGTGKTALLQELKNQGHQIIDLEALASHRGSAFGALGLAPQPSQESFENALAWSIHALDPSREVWLENESRLVGKIKLPNSLYDTLRQCAVYEIDLPLPVRMDRIWDEYGTFARGLLTTCTQKIENKLGSERTRLAIQALERGDIKGWLDEILFYYDRQYQKASDSRRPESIRTFKFEQFDQKKIASVLADAIPHYPAQ